MVLCLAIDICLKYRSLDYQTSKDIIKRHTKNHAFGVKNNAHLPNQKKRDSNSN